MQLNKFQIKALEKEYDAKILTLKLLKTKNKFKEKIAIKFESLQREITIESDCNLIKNKTMYECAEELLSCKHQYKIIKTR